MAQNAASDATDASSTNANPKVPNPSTSRVHTQTGHMVITRLAGLWTRRKNKLHSVVV